MGAPVYLPQSVKSNPSIDVNFPMVLFYNRIGLGEEREIIRWRLNCKRSWVRLVHMQSAMDEIGGKVPSVLSPLEERLCRYGLNAVVKREVEAAPAKAKNRTQFNLPLAGGETPRASNNTILIVLCVASLLSGCTVCSANRVFPKMAWAWTKDAKMEREARRSEKAYHDSLK